MARPLLAALAGSALAALPTAAAASKYEQPAYVVEAAHDGWEVRRYAPTVEARVVVEGPFEDVRSQGFRLLARYIFGGNGADEQIAMTSPVTAAPSPEGRTDIPADLAVGDVRAWTIVFTMPSSWTVDTLPPPKDGRVEIVQAEGGRWAARAFTMSVTTERAERERAALLADLAAMGLRPAGPAAVAQYEGPFTLPFLRRNEVLVPLEDG